MFDSMIMPCSKYVELYEHVFRSFEANEFPLTEKFVEDKRRWSAVQAFHFREVDPAVHREGQKFCDEVSHYYLKQDEALDDAYTRCSFDIDLRDLPFTAGISQQQQAKFTPGFGAQ